jgi:hypothetical protein
MVQTNEETSLPSAESPTSGWHCIVLVWVVW